MQRETIIDEDGYVWLIRGFLAPGEAERAFHELEQALPWGQEYVNFCGRRPLPRLTAWLGEICYEYSGVIHHPAPMPDALMRVVDRIATVAPRPDGVLANFYRDGSDSVSWHADDEEVFWPDPVITSLSLGGARRFVLRRVTDHTRRHALDLRSGDLLVMQGATQRFWQHCVPKTKKPVGPRINLTGRESRIADERHSLITGKLNRAHLPSAGEGSEKYQLQPKSEVGLGEPGGLL